MDDQQNQTMQPAGVPTPGVPADPMAQPAMPSTPPMPTPDMSGAMGQNPAADPMAVPPPPSAPTGMDSLAGMTPPPPPPVPAMDPMSMAAPMAVPQPQADGPLVQAPAPAAGPATLEDVMAELRKIEDKLVEMDEKL